MAWWGEIDFSGWGWVGDANLASLTTMEEMMRAFKNIENMVLDTANKLTTGADHYEQQEATNRAALGS
jgi:hypothetical protein